MVAVRFPGLGFLDVTRRNQTVHRRRTHDCGHPAGQGTEFALHTWWAFLIYSFSLVLPCVYDNSRLVPLFGLLAFLEALGTLVNCIVSPATALAGDWLLGLSWLANPAIWAGMVFLLMGKTRLAARAGQLSLLLAVCALRPLPLMVCQYVWLASMVYVVYAALCVPYGVPADDDAILSKPSLPKLCRTFCSAVALPVLFGLLLLLLDQQGHIKSTSLIP